jgi:DNA-binding MarR family transcriptional regulator
MSSPERLTDAEYQRLADFRHALRKFLYFSEQAAASEGLTPQQYQAMLAIRGVGKDLLNVATLADRLCLKHNTVVELIQRLEKAGLIHKQHSPHDGRSVVLGLTEEGADRLNRLAVTHTTELKCIGPEILKRLSKISS